MEEKNNIDKYTAKILKHLDLEKPPGDFTEKIMDKILSEQTEVKKMEAFGSKRFFILFTMVFISIVILVLYLPNGESASPESINAAKDFLSRFQIDFSFISTPILSAIKDNIIIKIIPVAIIILIFFERVLLRYSDNWKA